ncbi:MAG: thiamine pyrophosphate-binding protein [Desulfobacterales bacterium]|nr:thiamine pyrophosphate-binding protein [Desulfobacterales bacterium]
MKDLYHRFLEGHLSRRELIASLAGVGVGVLAADSLARDLEPYSDSFPEIEHATVRKITGKGGALLVAQLVAAGVEYVFLNPSSSAGPVYDALVDTTQIQIIESLHEGNLTAMADGYARATGKTPFVLISRAGLPNAMTQMYNSWKDNIPIIVATGEVNSAALGQNGFQDVDHRDIMTQPITKWRWAVQDTRKIPEITRRAFKFASTQPGGPVFISFTADCLHGTATATIVDQDLFTVSMRVRPNPDQVASIANLLLGAKNPLLYVGDEITLSGAEAEVLQLAETLSLPVALANSITRSIPFPTTHPLYLGTYQKNLRYPGEIDVMINIGGRMPFAGSGLQIEEDVRLIQLRMDPTDLARNYPTDIAVFSDIKLALRDLLVELEQRDVRGKLNNSRARRLVQAKAFAAERQETLNGIVKKRWERNPISIQRLLVEMDTSLAKDTHVVTELDSGAYSILSLMRFGGTDKTFVGNKGIALGWGLPAAFGVKLAKPEVPVVAIMGDGAFLFSGPQPLWSYSRYQAPITVVVLNNRSYNNERNRLWAAGGRQFETGRDMVCYIGNPDTSFVKLADAFGVKGETIDAPADIQGAIKRAQLANQEGYPYLLDVRVERNGLGALSSWHPEFSIAARRQRKV